MDLGDLVWDCGFQVFISYLYVPTIIANPYLLHSIMPSTFNQTREPLDPVSFLCYSLAVQKLTANNNKQVYLINLPLYVP